jgi:hypothetical protein
MEVQAALPEGLKEVEESQAFEVTLQEFGEVIPCPAEFVDVLEVKWRDIQKLVQVLPHRLIGVGVHLVGSWMIWLT